MNQMPVIRREPFYNTVEVLSRISTMIKNGREVFIQNCQGKRHKVEFDGDLINLCTTNMKLFATKGVECVGCGIKGVFFVKEIKT